VFPVVDPDGASRRLLGIVIADVSGKGISAAMLMAFVRPVVRAAVDHSGDPVEALERTNRILVEERPTGLLVTVLCGILDLDTGEFRFANGGHEPPLLVRAAPAAGPAAAPGGDEASQAAGDAGPARERASWVTTSGPLLGAFRSLGLVHGSVTLDPGDSLVLYTDGVTDARRPAGERFGPERFATLVADQCAVSASAVVQGVMRAVAEWEGPESADDLALLVLRRASETARGLDRAGARPRDAR
jgi:phosphoserine phosphatase RsbU/P